MPFEALIRINGIEGRSSAGAPSGEIHVRSFHWGVSRLSTSTDQSGQSDGAVHAQEFSFVKRVDATSPILLRRCWTGEHVPDAVFMIRQAHGEPRECLKYTFRDVLISAVRPGGSSESEDHFPAEEISLSFAQCALEYWSQGADGGMAIEPIHSGWHARQDIT